VSIHPTAKVSEQVNRKCPLRTRFYNFQLPTPTPFPQTGVRGYLINSNEFMGALKMLDVKMTDVKLTDQFAGHEIAGHEIEGPVCRA